MEREKPMETVVEKGLTPADYQCALDVQSACNLSGVVHSFSEIIGRIWEEAHKDLSEKRGTDWVNNHPICRLFAEQISFLSSKTDYFDASKECREKSTKE
jgi:hypothetical protein